MQDPADSHLIKSSYSKRMLRFDNQGQHMSDQFRGGNHGAASMDKRRLLTKKIRLGIRTMFLYSLAPRARKDVLNLALQHIQSLATESIEITHPTNRHYFYMFQSVVTYYVQRDSHPDSSIRYMSVAARGSHGLYTVQCSIHMMEIIF